MIDVVVRFFGMLMLIGIGVAFAFAVVLVIDAIGRIRWK